MTKQFRWRSNRPWSINLNQGGQYTLDHQSNHGLAKDIFSLVHHNNDHHHNSDAKTKYWIVCILIVQSWITTIVMIMIIMIIIIIVIVNQSLFMIYPISSNDDATASTATLLQVDRVRPRRRITGLQLLGMGQEASERVRVFLRMGWSFIG